MDEDICNEIKLFFLVKEGKLAEAVSLGKHFIFYLVVLPSISNTFSSAKIYFTDTGNMHCQ